MVGNSKISYEPLNTYGNLEEQDSLLTLHTQDYRRLRENDSLFFIREDGPLKYKGSRNLVSSEDTVNGGEYVVEAFEKRYPHVVSVCTIDVTPYPTASTTEQYIEITFEREHYFNANPEDRTLAGVIFPDGFDTIRKKCPGDIVRFEKLFLKANSVVDGEYVYDEMTVDNTPADIFYVDYDGVTHHLPCIVPVSDGNTDDRYKLLLKITDDNFSDTARLVNTQYSELYVYDARFLRLENFAPDGFFTYSLTKGTTVCTEEGNYRLSVPFGQDFETDLGREEALLEHFYAEVDGQINKIVDFEKQSFSPVYRDNSGEWRDVSKIVFNVHLRDRSVEEGSFEQDPEWKYDERYYWNNYPGVSGGVLFPKDAEIEVNDADLVGYAGFDDDDIYYQKKKVSNTFIRVSIYNTPNRGDQKLLYSAKIYLNPGLLYGKYVKQLRKAPVEGEEDVPVVFREGDKENRLGLSFVCTHKYDYDNPSEGFYFHLFPSNLSELESTEVYMKVEFNNAKYGYSIQLTMPEKKGAGTFTEMAGDNTLVPIDPETADFPTTYIYGADGNVKVDMARLSKDMYIPVRIRYDEDKKRYVWFLPTSGDLTDNTMVFNLFEPRVNGVPYKTDRFTGYGTYSSGNSGNGNSGGSNAGGNSGGNSGDTPGGNTGGGGGDSGGTEPGGGGDEPGETETPEEIVTDNAGGPVVLKSQTVQSTSGVTAVRIYQNGLYRLIDGDGSTGTATADGYMFTGTAKRVDYVSGSNSVGFSFEDSETVVAKNESGDTVTDVVKYVTVVGDSVGVPGSYNLRIWPADTNYSTKTVTVQTVFNYDLQNGDLRIYDDGSYRFVKDGDEEEYPEVLGKLLNAMDPEKNISLYMGKTYKLEESEVVMDGGVPATRRYVTLPASDFSGLRGYRLYLNFNDGSALSRYIDIISFDSGINATFKVHEVVIDRSNVLPIGRQMPYGDNLTQNYVNGSEGLNPSMLKFTSDSPVIKLYRWSYDMGPYSKFDETIDSCNWQDGGVAHITMSIGNQVLDTMTIRVVTNDPNKVYIRGAESTCPRCYVGETHKLGEFLRFIPADSNFSYLGLDELRFFSGNNNILSVTKSETLPTTWDEFYNDYIFVNCVSPGITRIYYIWESDKSSNGGGGDYEVRVSSVQ